MSEYTLVGIDGNAFSILAYVRKAMKIEGYSQEEIDKYLNEAKSSNYDHLLSVSIDMIDEINSRRRES